MKTKFIRNALENYCLYLEDFQESTAWAEQIKIDMLELNDAFIELDEIEGVTK